MSYQTSLKFSGTNLASSLYGVLLVPIGQFISVTYPRRTGWERPHIFAWTTRPETLWPRGIMRPRDQASTNQHLVRHCPQGLFLPFFTFLRAIFFRPFRLSLALTICPWVSEDDRVENGPNWQKFFLTGRCKPYFNSFNLTPPDVYKILSVFDAALIFKSHFINH